MSMSVCNCRLETLSLALGCDSIRLTFFHKFKSGIRSGFYVFAGTWAPTHKRHTWKYVCKQHTKQQKQLHPSYDRLL